MNKIELPYTGDYRIIQLPDDTYAISRGMPTWVPGYKTIDAAYVAAEMLAKQCDAPAIGFKRGGANGD